jgi:hypothetical protein
MSGNLRSATTSAWRMGKYTQPKTTKPNQEAKTMPTAKPPSNRAYHQDILKSINDPAHGVRASLVPTAG